MTDQDNFAKIETIVAIKATALKNFMYQIEAVFADGTREVLFAKSRKGPGALAHVFTGHVNRAAKGRGFGSWFLIAKNINSDFLHCHAKTFIVQ
jgi:hypothetical protein